jgi:sensor domain CHASE-containing protein
MPFAPEHDAARRLNDSELRRLMNLTACGVATAALLLVAVIAYASWAANSSATAREKTLVDNALNRGIQRALQEQKRVSWLDDTYQKLSGGTFDAEFLETEFGIILTET